MMSHITSLVSSLVPIFKLKLNAFAVVTATITSLLTTPRVLGKSKLISTGKHCTQKHLIDLYMLDNKQEKAD